MSTGCLNFFSATPSPEPPPPPAMDYDVVVILAAMLCALLCALGLNSVLQQCIARCTRRAVAGPVDWVVHRRANAGLKREVLVALPVATYNADASPAQKQQQASAGAGCAICLSDFADGESVRVLPVCEHRFHVACVDRWLVSRCSCPTCRRRLSPDRGDGGKESRRELLVLNAV
ncbi:hypothetical protein QYE76_036287 [Lolium multiflorum]|uniref:RING-type domain-containing protein n=1 Tax=Lolium multiflorum TaxID=4521 RepID=A0AAD8R448_LOLMU|nr:hypothetical protein QYE76_036287 [Lolium multiflorum]